MEIINNKDGVFVELPKDKITFCGDNEEDKITFCGDNEEDKKRNEILYDLSLENDLLKEKIKELEEENNDLKRDNGFYQDCMNIIKAVLHKSGFIWEKVNSEDVENCDAEFVIKRNDDNTIELFKQMVEGKFEEI